LLATIHFASSSLIFEHAVYKLINRHVIDGNVLAFATSSVGAVMFLLGGTASIARK